MLSMKLLAVCSLALSSNAKNFLPLKSEDPADALASKILKKIGLDSDEKKVPVAVERSNLVSSHAQSSVSHSRLSSKDLMGLKPMIGAGDLSSPKEWAEAPSQKDNDESDLASLKDGMKHMYQDLSSPASSTSTADWSQYEDARSESTKEIVKVFDRDAIVHQPVPETVPHVTTSHDESSVPSYVSKLRIPLPPVPASGSSAGIRWFKQPSDAHAVRDESSQPVGFENVTELNDKVERMVHENEDTDSLAKSLSSHFKMEKKKEVARMQRPHLPTGEVHNKTVPEASINSALDSVHRVRGAKKMLPVSPEDVHNETDPVEAPEPEETKPLLRQPTKRVSIADPDAKNFKPAKKKQLTEKNPLQNLFNEYAVGGFVDANGMEGVLKTLGTKKAWNWRLFDKDSDDKLSDQEFANAMAVAQRFKNQK